MGGKNNNQEEKKVEEINKAKSTSVKMLILDVVHRQ